MNFLNNKCFFKKLSLFSLLIRFVGLSLRFSVCSSSFTETQIYVQLWKVVDSNARVAVVVATAVRQPGGGSEPSAELEELGLARPELG